MPKKQEKALVPGSIRVRSREPRKAPAESTSREGTIIHHCLGHMTQRDKVHLSMGRHCIHGEDIGRKLWCMMKRMVSMQVKLKSRG